MMAPDDEEIDSTEDNNKGKKETVESAGDFIKNFGDKLNASFASMIDVSFPAIMKEVQQLDVESTKVTKSFGQGRENIQQIKAAMADATASVVGLGGSYTDVTNIQLKAAEALNRNVILGGDVYKDIYAASQVTGQQAESLFPKFKDVGVSAYGVAQGMQKIVDAAREQGVSVQAVSEQAVKNLDSMNKYNFQGGVEGLAKMATQATSLRIDMGTTLKFADGLYNPEKAIEMSSALQRLGVTQSDLLDPLRLMDLSLNDPTELQNQLVKMTEQFVQLNDKGQFEIAPQGKLQLREISKATGIAYEELTKMAMGSAELEDKLRKIKFPDFMSEDQQKMVANLAEMKDGEYVITIDGKEQKLADVLANTNNKEQLDKLIESSKPKTMEDLAAEQLDMQKSMVASLKAIEGRAARGVASTKLADTFVRETTKATRAGSGVLTEGGALGTGVVRETFDKGSSELISMFKKSMEGDFNFEEEQRKLLELAKNVSVDQSKIIGDNLTSVMNQYGVTMEQLPEGMRKQLEEMTKSGVEPEKPVKTEATPAVSAAETSMKTMSEPKSEPVEIVKKEVKEVAPAAAAETTMRTMSEPKSEPVEIVKKEVKEVTPATSAAENTMRAMSEPKSESGEPTKREPMQPVPVIVVAETTMKNMSKNENEPQQQTPFDTTKIDEYFMSASKKPESTQKQLETITKTEAQPSENPTNDYNELKEYFAKVFEKKSESVEVQVKSIPQTETQTKPLVNTEKIDEYFSKMEKTPVSVEAQVKTMSENESKTDKTGVVETDKLDAIQTAYENSLKKTESKSVVPTAQPVATVTEEVVSTETPETEEPTAKPVESKLDININVTSPSTMSQQQVLEALNVREIKEKIYKIYEEMNKDFKKKG